MINQTADQTPLALATKLGEQGFFTWDGNYYALNLTEHLDVEKSGGFLRIGLVHYNTAEEVDRLLAALKEILQPSRSKRIIDQNTPRSRRELLLGESRDACIS